MVWIAIISICSVAALFILIKYTRLPAWSHRDVLAFIALIATIGGAAILTGLKWAQVSKFNDQTDRLITELVKTRSVAINHSVGDALQTIVGALAWDLKLTSLGIIVVLLSLGLVISSRVIRGKIWGNELELSNIEREQRAAAAAAQSVAGAAREQADEITDETVGEGELPESEKIK